MKERRPESSYYGIPVDIQKNGINAQGHLCSTEYEHRVHHDRKADRCKPMKKQYYLQYQYMPFYTASLAFLFYIPYMIFKVSNLTYNTFYFSFHYSMDFYN